MTTDPFLRRSVKVKTKTSPARFAPMRGWRYASHEPLDRVLTPPYDVIDLDTWKEYYERHPHNIVRLILPTAPTSTGTQDGYEQAARTQHAWQRGGILRQDEEATFYILRQTFTDPAGRPTVRFGIVGRLLLRPWGEGIFPHEQTFPAAKADRLALLEATGTQFSPIFTLFPDPTGNLRLQLGTLAQTEPERVYHDEEGVEHALWRISEPDVVAQLSHELSQRPLYVADGHHRYETALNYQRRRRAQQPDAPPGQPFDYVMVYAAAMEDPGVTILPTHRALRPAPTLTPERILSQVVQSYDITPIERDEDLLQWVHHLAPGLPDIALVFPHGPAYRLHLRLDRPHVQALQKRLPSAIFNLAVYQLQALILGPGAGVSDDPGEQKKRIHFSPNAAELLREVRAGHWGVVAFVAPTSMEQLKALADARLIAPPKATYFYPKLPSGLIMYRPGQERSS